MVEYKNLAYLPMAVDMVHPGHINIIKAAVSLGATVMVGCYSDEAIASYKRLPFMSYEQRKEVIGSIKGVDIVVQQRTRDLEENIRQYKPQYVVHGTDWRDGALSGARARTLSILKEWGGKLVEPEYTQGISSTVGHIHLRQVGTTPAERTARLRRLLHVKKSLQAMQVHDAVSALTVENTIVNRSGQPTAEFDAFWLNEKIISQAKGGADSNLVDFSQKRITVNEIFDVTTKPLIFDGGNTIGIENFAFTVKVLERLGVSAITVEDNKIDDFTKKIRAGKSTQLISEFMIIAKIAGNYFECPTGSFSAKIKETAESPADAVMVKYCDTYKEKFPEVIQAINKYNASMPIFVVTDQVMPSISESITVPHCLIYNSHLFSSSCQAMADMASQILCLPEVLSSISV